MTIWQEQRQAAGNPSQDSEHSSVADILSNSNEVELQLRGGGSVPLEELENPSVKYRPPSASPDPHSVNPAWLKWTITKFDGSNWDLFHEKFMENCETFGVPVNIMGYLMSSYIKKNSLAFFTYSEAIRIYGNQDIKKSHSSH